MAVDLGAIAQEMEASESPSNTSEQTVTESSAPQGTDPLSPGAAAPPEPTHPAAVEEAKNLRAELMKAQLEKIKAARADRKDAARAAALKEEADKRYKEVEEYDKTSKQRWQDALKDPIKAYQSMGIAPDKLYEEITNRVLNDQKPESQLEVLRQELAALKSGDLSEVAKLKAELEELKSFKKSYEQRNVQTEVDRAINTYMTELKDSKFDRLRAVFSPEELIREGDTTAVRLQKELKRQPSIKEIAERVHTELTSRFSKWDSSAQSNAGSAEPSRTEESAKGSGAAEQKPTTTLTNNLAAASANTTTKKLSKEERMREAAALLEATLRTRK